ncbi:MAG: ABC transporter ATP-binding protein/permease [Bacilli bacterium]|nr:ABC transporter ATP-binding protein/permease [Bacilli bacterium]
MQKIRIENLSKEYKLKNSESFFALKNINASLPNTGLVTIIGKSGSGKSTLLNMIALLDTPTKGAIYIDNKDLKKYKNKTSFYKKKVGILFQNYNLLTDLSTSDNVLMPLLINGIRKSKALKKASEILEFVGISKEKYKLKSSLLSGGEKQRVALARSIVNSPEILLCDEPTGALDNNNSVLVMDLLKKISETTLVILVSHNLQLCNRYSDRIIEISNGTIKYDRTVNKNEKTTESAKNKCKKSSIWLDKLLIHNYLKRIKRNLFSIASLTIGLTTILLTVGFYFGKDSAISVTCKRQFDYGVGTISEDEVINGSSLLKLTRSVRPKISRLISISQIFENYYIFLNYDTILMQNLNIKFENESVDSLILTPVYSLDCLGVNDSLVIKRSGPNEYNSTDVFINKYCYDYLKSHYNFDPIGDSLNITAFVQSKYVDMDEEEIDDELQIDLEFTIKGVVDELDYLTSPKIYYNYSYIDYYFECQLLPNLSTYFNRDISWKTRLEECDDSSPLTSYSYRLFPKRFGETKLNLETTNLVFTSSSLLVEESLYGFADTIEYTIFIFLIIAMIGVAMILGISSFSSYSDDKKESAILTCIGASKDEIYSIYIGESLLTTIISICFSIPLSLYLTKLLNPLITKYTDVKNLISIPLDNLFGIRYFLPIILLIGCVIFSVLITYIPIKFSKGNNLKSELQSL